MKKLNNFDVKMPLLLMGGGIPLKGYAFYVSFDNETYYGAEFDRMTLTSCLRITNGKHYYDYHTVIYFHCAIGNLSAEFYKGENSDAIFVKVKDTDRNKELLIPIAFYATRNAIENGKAMRMSFGYDNVSFNNLPFFDMQADKQSKDPIMGKTYILDEHNNVETMSVPINRFDVECINNKLTATHIAFWQLTGKRFDLGKCFATKEECMRSIKRKYKIVELPKKKTVVAAGVIIELNGDDMI